jgi:hypothetical protein
MAVERDTDVVCRHILSPLSMNHRSRHQHGSFVNFLTACIFWTNPTSTARARPLRYNWRMDNATNDASSSVGFLVDIFRLIPPSARSAFADMLAHELRGRDLPDEAMRRVAVNIWHQFCKHGWRRI